MLLPQHTASQLCATNKPCSTPFNITKYLLRQQCAAQSRQRTTAVVAAASAAAVDTQPFDSLSQWLTSKGGSVGSITAGDCQMGEVTVRGLIATHDLAPNTPIISVPVSSTLRDDKAGEAYPDAPWNANLAAQLLDEKALGSASPFWPYLQTLPDSCCSPLLLPEQQLHEVQYAPAITAISSYQDAVRVAYESCCEARAGKGLPAFSWGEWVWAVHMVQSRSIRLAITGCKVLIPGIDLLNHGGSAANGQLVLGKASWQVDGEPAVCFVTTKHIAAGEQVLWSYGTRGNDDYFVYHGFALPDNPDEDIVLFDDVHQLAHWAVQHVPELQGLRQLGYSQQAAAAAARASQDAAAHCSAAAIPGTSSSLLLPLQPLLQQLQEAPSKLQQQQQQRWQQQLQDGSSNSSIWACEAAVLAAMRHMKLHRRLASCRLHSPVWGTSECPPTVPELVLRRDSCLDVRIPAVLASLHDMAAAAAAASGSMSSTSTSSSSSFDHVGQVSSKALSEMLLTVVRCRCQELFGGFASSLEQDLAWLRHFDGTNGSQADWLMASVVQYRLGKKQALRELL